MPLMVIGLSVKTVFGTDAGAGAASAAGAATGAITLVAAGLPSYAGTPSHPGTAKAGVQKPVCQHCPKPALTIFPDASTTYPVMTGVAEIACILAITDQMANKDKTTVLFFMIASLKKGLSLCVAGLLFPSSPTKTFNLEFGALTTFRRLQVIRIRPKTGGLCQHPQPGSKIMMYNISSPETNPAKLPEAPKLYSYEFDMNTFFRFLLLKNLKETPIKFVFLPCRRERARVRM